MIRDISEARTIAEVIKFHAFHTPDKTIYTYLSDGETEAAHLTYGELDKSAAAFAKHILQSAKPGDRVILLYPTGCEFVTAFFGCLYAGVIAVPSIIPHVKKATARLQAILNDSDASTACAPKEIYNKIQNVTDEYPELGKISWIIHEEIPEGTVESEAPLPGPNAVAFLQYTSGSTSAPKGVIITNANLLATIRDLYAAMAPESTTVCVSWLPLFHDMGLIGALLTMLYGSKPVYNMPPVAFIEKPIRWLKAITKYKGTHTAAPNFAYELCLQRITEEEKKELDLHSMKYMVNAAEPIRLETVRRFTKEFTECNFQDTAFSPCYGLAEATVMVTGKDGGEAFSYVSIDSKEMEQNKLVFVPENHPNSYTCIGCGWSHIDAKIRIVNSQTCLPANPNEIGEIWLQSVSVAQGYWGRPEETRNTFQATITGENNAVYMRTGDMGFIHNGQLYIAGRLKDMLIIQGRNYYPQDIELTAEKAHPALVIGSNAAFAVEEEGAEHLVLIQEISREYRKSSELPNIAAAIRMAIAKNHGLRAHAVLLINPASIHKTSSGKIQRQRNKEAFLEGTLKVVYEWRAPGSFEKIKAAP